jgi:hypothetical protein
MTQNSKLMTSLTEYEYRILVSTDGRVRIAESPDARAAHVPRQATQVLRGGSGAQKLPASTTMLRPCTVHARSATGAC